MEVTGGGGFPSLPPSFSSMVVADRRSHQQQHVLILSAPNLIGPICGVLDQLEMGLETKPFIPSEIKRKQEEEEPVAVEDNIFANSRWEAPPTFLSWSYVKEQVEVELETKSFIPSEVERKEEEEEPVDVEDNIFASSFFLG
nr:ubiquitin carboxyl-terminal hydrolase 21-like [Ipomoea batatas]